MGRQCLPHATHDGADPCTSGLAPDPPDPYGQRTRKLHHSNHTLPLKQSRRAIKYIAHSRNCRHPRWPLPRPAPGMWPRGLSRKRNGEGYAASAGAERGSSMLEQRREKGVACRCSCLYGGRGNHGLEMDDLRNSVHTHFEL